jgi:Phosphotransferase enzyme family
MIFRLDSANVFDYLERTGFLLGKREDATVQLLEGKNFNLLVRFPDCQPLLVKQEDIEPDGTQSGEVLTEWQLQQLLPQLPELQAITDLMPKVVHCDRANSIVINQFQDRYTDLIAYYQSLSDFSLAIPTAIGQNLALVHQLSFNRSDYQQHIQSTIGTIELNARKVASSLARVDSTVFGMMPLECLRFFKLYQQYPSLSAAIDELAQTSHACCLVHNDLKLNNILIHKSWTDTEDSIVRLIDWEKAGWGDPAGDVGMLIASYLILWLESLIITPELTIQESIGLAATPLELLQPSIFTFVHSYLNYFPEIRAARPQYLLEVLRYTGLSLIIRIQANLENEQMFGNQGIVMLQVAKQLLCTPAAFMSTVFGANADRF